MKNNTADYRFFVLYKELAKADFKDNQKQYESKDNFEDTLNQLKKDPFSQFSNNQDPLDQFKNDPFNKFMGGGAGGTDASATSKSKNAAGRADAPPVSNCKICKGKGCKTVMKQIGPGMYSQSTGPCEEKGCVAGANYKEKQRI